jgi:hypothetical protein
MPHVNAVPQCGMPTHPKNISMQEIWHYFNPEMPINQENAARNSRAKRRNQKALDLISMQCPDVEIAPHFNEGPTRISSLGP